MAPAHEGETFVPGRSRATARAIVAAAKELEVDMSTLRSTREGYYVPDEVATRAGELAEAAGDDTVDLGEPTPFAPTNLADERKPGKSRKDRLGNDAFLSDEKRPKVVPAPDDTPAVSNPAAPPAGTPETVKTDEQIAEEKAAADKKAAEDAAAADAAKVPTKASSRDTWVDYVKTIEGHDPADLEDPDADGSKGLGRNALADKYGPKSD